jgi:lysyl-tRNA synthetase class 2
VTNRDGDGGAHDASDALPPPHSAAAAARRAHQSSVIAALRRGEDICDPFAGIEVLTVEEAFRRYAGIDLLATAPDPQMPDRERLAAEVRRIGLRTADGDTWEDLYFRVSLELIEPHLGRGRPTVLIDWPLSMAALARPKPDDGRVAERFELYACGVELANAFGELTDPAVQRARFEADMAEKQRLYGERFPLDEEFLAALALFAITFVVNSVAEVVRQRFRRRAYEL